MIGIHVGYLVTCNNHGFLLSGFERSASNSLFFIFLNVQNEDMKEKIQEPCIEHNYKVEAKKGEILLTPSFAKASAVQVVDLKI